MRTILTALLVAGATNYAAAQLQDGFKDFDVAQGIASSTPHYLTEFDGKLYFYGSNGTTGREPHFVVGGNSPMLIDNINPASNHCIGIDFNKPGAGMNGKYYFTANNGTAGDELYEYDGTAVKLLYDHDFGGDSSRPDNYIVLGGVLYYTAITAAEGQELWSYNGTGVPTRLTDVNTGTGDGVSGPMAVLGSKLYFIGNDGTNGAELWSYNPATSTASMEANIATGGSSSDPANLTTLNSKIYFSATDFTYGREVYEYDGTNPPARLTDVNPDALSSISPTDRNAFAWFNNKLYFAARDTSGENHLYSYSAGNTVLEHKINPNGDSGPRELVVYNGRLFFTANDGANGYELFAYDGTNPPAIVGDLCPGTNSSLPQSLTPIGDELYFSANNCNNSGIDLFSYNYKRVSISNTLFDGSVDVFPNPVGNELNIDLTLKREERLQVRLADVTGKNIYDEGMRMYKAGKNKTNIPMKNMPPGNYIYYVTNEQGTTYLTGKVVKQ